MDTKPVSLKGVKVMIAIPGGRNPPWDTVGALIQTSAYLASLGVPFVPAVVKGNALVTRARDELVDIFLASDCNRLFWIDDDIVWQVDDFMRILALSMLVDIVAASYPTRCEPARYFINTLGGGGVTQSLSEYGLLEVEGLGLGFTCMRREVVEAIHAKARTLWDSIQERRIHNVFRLDKDYKGSFCSEDMAFFHDARECGYRVWVDPNIELGHVGQKVYRGRLMDVLSNGHSEEYAAQVAKE